MEVKMNKIIIVPIGKLKSDDAAAARRRELAERLKRGEDVSVTSTGQVVASDDPIAENGKVLKAPEGKLADHSCRCCGGSGQMKCPRCDGTGTFIDGTTCYYCKGKGRVECSACDGKGRIED